MAALMAQRPSAATVQRVLDAFLSARTWEGNPALDVFTKLIDRLPDDSLPEMPSALGEALLPLRLSPTHLELALDTVFEFDLYESSEGLARLLLEEAGPRVLAAATALAMHPGAAPILKDQILAAVSQAEVPDPHIAQLLRISLAPDAEASSRPYEVARIRRWPGTAAISQAPAPMVALAPSAGTPADLLRFVLDLRRAGAVVRRLPPSSPEEHLDPRWLARWMPLVAADRDGEAWWSALPHGRIVETGGRLTPATRRETLRRVDAGLPPGLRLRLREDSADGGVATSALDSLEAFLSGALRTHEMAFLSGLSARRLLSNTREEPALQPVRRANLYHWPFPVLVGLRVWAYLSQRLQRRLPRSIAVDLVEKARGERAVPVAVTGGGEVLFHVEDDVYEGTGGQLTSEHFLLKEHVFERFTIGQRHAPRLEEPTKHTSVHPGVLGGTPAVRGTRVPAEAVEALVRSCHRAGMRGERLYEYVQDRYPELDGAAVIDDAADLARRMLAVG